MYQLFKNMLQKPGIGEHDVDYHVMTYGLIILRDEIYVLDNNKLKKLILWEFHVKLYLGQRGYQKTWETVK